MALENFSIEINLPTLSAIAGVALFVWARYQALEQRLGKYDREIHLLQSELAQQTQAIRSELDQRLHAMEHRLELSRQAISSQDDHKAYLINANRELIDHRTERFTQALSGLEGALKEDINDLKRFLEKTTEFVDRRRRDPGVQ